MTCVSLVPRPTVWSLLRSGNETGHVRLHTSDAKAWSWSKKACWNRSPFVYLVRNVMNTLDYIPDPIKQTETNVFFCSPVKFSSGFKQGSDSVCRYVCIPFLPMC